MIDEHVVAKVENVVSGASSSHYNVYATVKKRFYLSVYKME